MVHDITMQQVACFRNRKNIRFNAGLNLFFGDNGTGKSTIATYLYAPQKPLYSFCSSRDEATEDFFIYTEAFVDEHFSLNDSLKSIFTLSKANKSIADTIDIINQRISTLVQNQQQLNMHLETLQKNFQKERNEVKDQIWEIKHHYGGYGNKLNFCLEGLKGDKEKLFDFVMKQHPPLLAPAYTLEDLTFELANDEQPFRSTSTFFDLLPEQKIALIEQSPAWLFPRRSAMDNQETAPWILQGLGYLSEFFLDTPQRCPFCQQETVSPSLSGELKNLLGMSYVNAYSNLVCMEQAYLELRDSLLPLQTYLQDDYVRRNKEDFIIRYCDIFHIWEYNGKLMRIKLRDPSQCVRLQDSIIHIRAMNSTLEQANHFRESRNKRNTDPAVVHAILKQKFWERVRWEQDQVIQSFEQIQKKYESETSDLRRRLTWLEDALDIARRERNETFLAVYDVQPAVDRINFRLEDWGIEDFHITKYVREKSGEEVPNWSSDQEIPYRYRLKRPESEGDVFTSLSTGEKQLISFLYFCETCRSARADDMDSPYPQGTKQERQKVVVIDDPTTGLSARYASFVAALIEEQFLTCDTEYTQVIILSHDRRFLEELGRRHGVEVSEL